MAELEKLPPHRARRSPKVPKPVAMEELEPPPEFPLALAHAVLHSLEVELPRPAPPTCKRREAKFGWTGVSQEPFVPFYLSPT
uniref:Uncharacterized protein n=1 Tax=Setaria italica TaxID=4555 RepID=K3Z233_SETIT